MVASPVRPARPTENTDTLRRLPTLRASTFRCAQPRSRCDGGVDCENEKTVTAVESWAPIPGWPGYEQSTRGRVRSLDRIVVDRLGRPRRLRGRELRLVEPRRPGSGGGPRVSLSRPGRKQTLYPYSKPLKNSQNPPNSGDAAAGKAV
jgi:hypothetical protein